MPHLTNMIAVTNLTMMKHCKTKEEAASIIHKLFQYGQTNINTIYLSPPGTEATACFIKFHHYTYMVEFLEKIGPNAEKVEYKIHKSHEIFEWFY